MKITIHRGTNQIGGCVTEYEQDGWRLFVDFGEQLPGAPSMNDHLQIDGLTCGDISKSALLITHYHGDHIGKIGELPENLPIYMGATALKIQKKSSEHLKNVNPNQCSILERLQHVRQMKPGKAVSFGPFQIMPISVDHSAFDAYAFKIEANGRKIFHTGDFRTHGFRSKKFPLLMNAYIRHVDYVVCEATNVDRPASTILTERELQKEFENAFRENKYNIVYVSSTNIDRLFSVYQAALKSGRPFYLNKHQKEIMELVGKDSVWGKSDLYQFGKYQPIELKQSKGEFEINENFLNFTSEKGYVLIARYNSRFDNLIEQLPGEPKVRYLSMWEGYVDPTNLSFNPQLANSVGSDYVYLHTSGHCDMESLSKVFEMLTPKAVIPIHTDNPETFARRFADKWPVILLKDGESLDVK